MDCPLVARELRRFWLYRINEVTGNREGSVADWLTKGSYSCIVPPAGSRFEVALAADDEPIRIAYASECGRFASAALETFLFSDPPPAQGKALAWNVIRSYYGAFFSAHALLRAFGRSVAYIDAIQARAISTILSLQLGGAATNVAPGIYALEVESRSRKLVATNLLARGSHEMLWAEFGGWIDFAAQSLSASGSPDSIAVADFLKRMKDGLSSAGSNNGAWLSVVRNQVNYSQSYGVWFPYKISDRRRDALHLMLSQWQQNMLPPNITPLTKGDELVRFTELCTALSSILLAVMHDISSRCPKGRSFVEQRALPLYNQMANSLA